MDYFKITAEVIERAVAYMPLATKGELAKSIADECVKAAKTAEQNKSGEKLLALPTLMIEDYVLKEILLLNTLIGFYFDIQIDEESDPFDTYDYYAGSNLSDQLRHFKGEEKLKEKAFSIWEDFRKFKKFVDTEIFNRKLVANDGMARFTASVQIGSSPEYIKQALEILKDIKAERLSERESGDKHGS